MLLLLINEMQKYEHFELSIFSAKTSAWAEKVSSISIFDIFNFYIDWYFLVLLIKIILGFQMSMNWRKSLKKINKFEKVFLWGISEFQKNQRKNSLL